MDPITPMTDGDERAQGPAGRQRSGHEQQQKDREDQNHLSLEEGVLPWLCGTRPTVPCRWRP